MASQDFGSSFGSGSLCQDDFDCPPPLSCEALSLTSAVRQCISFARRPDVHSRGHVPVFITEDDEIPQEMVMLTPAIAIWLAIFFSILAICCYKFYRCRRSLLRAARRRSDRGIPHSQTNDPRVLGAPLLPVVSHQPPPALCEGAPSTTVISFVTPGPSEEEKDDLDLPPSYEEAVSTQHPHHPDHLCNPVRHSQDHVDEPRLVPRSQDVCGVGGKMDGA